MAEVTPIERAFDAFCKGIVPAEDVRQAASDIIDIVVLYSEPVYEVGTDEFGSLNIVARLKSGYDLLIDYNVYGRLDAQIYDYGGGWYRVDTLVESLEMTKDVVRRLEDTLVRWASWD